MTTSDQEAEQTYVTALDELLGLGVIQGWLGPEPDREDGRPWEVESRDGTVARLSPDMLWAFIEGARAASLVALQDRKTKRPTEQRSHRRV
jgi:hypothetical protein